MKPFLFLSILSWSVITCCSQSPNFRGEFATNTNGLMYNDSDMQALRFIVDSLNIRFKTCDLNKTFYGYPQAKVYRASFRSKKNDLKEIIRDLNDTTDFYELIRKYSSFFENSDTTDILIQYGPNENKYTYLEGSPGEGYDNLYLEEKDELEDFTKGKKWIYSYSAKGDYIDEYSITCRYFPGKWKRQSIPQKYARLIQYVDCMIDTSASIFLTDNKTGRWYFETDKNHYTNLEKLSGYISKKMNQKNFNKKELDSSQYKFALKNLLNDSQFKTILEETIDDCIKKENINYQLESLAEESCLFAKALQMKRNYIVVGGCSQDSRPREHARDIATLAARSHNWDIFLRAHLDIMNDRFERASDGSYAWGERKTYLKELEELNLDIVDLMLGLTFRTQNAPDNHYFGTIWRLGWALTESKEKDIFEKKALDIIKDPELDEFNRGLVFLLYKTYVYHLNDKKEVRSKISFLKNAMNDFPEFVRVSINNLGEPKDKEE
jgi:hypothetical protein